MKANPLAILTIGIGVLLLNLAYTGRGEAVWNAITGGGGGSKSDTPGDGDTPPVTEDDRERAGIQDPVSVRRVSDNAEMVADAPDLEGPRPDGSCHAQAQAVIGPDGKTYCVWSDKLYPAGPSGGDAEHLGLWGLTGSTWGRVVGW